MESFNITRRASWGFQGTKLKKRGEQNVFRSSQTQLR